MSIQVPDYLIFRGRDLQLYSYPLESYVRDLPARPDFQLRGAMRDRGYVASWEVRGDHTLWLTGLQSRGDDGGPDPGLTLLFPTTAPVAATWVRQPLRAIDNRVRRFSPIGNGTAYPREWWLSVWAGRVVAVEEVDGLHGRRVAGELTADLEAVFGPEEAGFLRAVFTSASDAAPRLVYADWLEERNDPRADVIRIAERLSRLEPERAAREQSAAHEVLARGLNDWLWARLMSYHGLTPREVSVAAAGRPLV